MRTNETYLQAAPGTGTSTARAVALWALQLLLAANFLLTGGGKLSGMEQMVVMFDEIGVGQWLRYFTGALEVGGALLLLVPRLAVFGAIGLAVVMVGAVVTELLILSGNALMPLALLVLLSLLGYARRPNGMVPAVRDGER